MLKQHVLKGITLQTSRLILRPFVEDDVDDVYDYASNPEVGPCAGWPAHKDKEETRRVLKIFMESGSDLAVVDKETMRVIGSISLMSDHYRLGLNVKEIGAVLKQEYWHKGLIPEAITCLLAYAFDTCDLDLVSAYCVDVNDRSRHMIESMKFYYEGTLRLAAQRYDGSVYDYRCYSMKKEEYLKLRDAGVL